MDRKIVSGFCFILVLLFFILPVSPMIAYKISDATMRSDGRNMEDWNVELTAEVTSKTIDISQNLQESDHYVEYSILLRNVTTGTDDLDVKVTVDNPTELNSDIIKDQNVITDSVITLQPNMHSEVIVRVSADEHEPMGDYVVTFKVMDELGLTLLNSTDLTTTVAQYYYIELEAPKSMSYSRIVDPNSMKNDPQVEEFEVLLENYGNGFDEVTIEWVENRDSPNAIPMDWESNLVEIYDKDSGPETIDNIQLPAYNKLLGYPGTEKISVKINIPKEEREGRFWIDIKVESSAPQSYVNNLQREDFEVEANWTFQIQMILPELSFNTDKSSILKPDGTKYIDMIDTIYVDDPISISVYIGNKGSAHIGDVNVEFSATRDNVPVYSTIEFISIGVYETENINFKFTPAKKGMHYFKVRIDPNNDVLGDNQQDNTWNQYLLVESLEPELSFDTAKCIILKSSGTAYVEQTDTIYSKDSLRIVTVIVNTGDATASDVKIEFSSTLDNVQLNSSVDVVTVKPGEDIQSSWNLQVINAGLYFFKVKIDPDNELIGDNNNDNTWTMNLYVKNASDKPSQDNDAPDITITTEDEDIYKPGNKIEIEGTWTDQDINDTISIQVKLILPNGTSTGYIPLPEQHEVIVSGQIWYVEINEDGTWLFTSDMKSWNLNGDYTFFFKAKDENDLIPKGSVSNEESITIILDDDYKPENEANEEKSNNIEGFNLVWISAIVVVIVLLILFYVIKQKKPSGNQGPKKTKTIPESTIMKRNPKAIEKKNSGQDIIEGEDENNLI